MISDTIRQRLLANNETFYANDDISHRIDEQELNLLIDEVSTNMESVLNSLVIDISNDHNTRETARRWAKMLINESFRGRYHPSPDITEFPNVKQVDELYVVGPIQVRSMCAHHLVPIIGEAFIGVFPGDHLIGLSKFHRIVDHFASRPQIQEELTVQITDKLEQLTNPKGIGVIINAKHLCSSHRGVKDNNSKMVTSVLRGCMRDHQIKSEFLKLVEFSKE